MKINLLPWRQDRLAANRKMFSVITLTTVAVACGTLYFVYSLFFTESSYLKSYAKALAQAKETTFLKVKLYMSSEGKQKELLERSQELRTLLLNRYDTVRLLNEITVLTPKGIYLTNLSRKDDSVEINGDASSNLQISQFMYSIEASKTLKVISLQKVEKTEGNELVTTQFDLKLSFSPSAVIKTAPVLPTAEKIKINNPIKAIQQHDREKDANTQKILKGE
ncbi:MAG: hypothetical protein A3I77_03130 [Gammaproteobacteria bacterium RIFCSPLOWO2_02_FULL_42_14]|nr:MAG: hypothetical protein A3B71_01110 [Gammaproteobacteria bacterium RIFCSPHIGHO2_02_FULL_42_43]OGT28794.1 MAG: hypothetical protein A2624_01400 [Gammaproteobacteria bacterium RIFCSPHIGHO2_01_FULL_42_8]OGT51665.1 MAG: hypothetical protein A3E54_03325 [Gammaproteobacteria bacterium RIFCSPHIGHO2_12_FULL_41_25]OGT61563.1 MAG: hypothetical protein A3I77_03130 [Gammaproteobacteria bacterium RIFCSPLOWO2_02_FULL_42_14]OGT86186.1 MAG: hypothetical protein A3G86_05980 [Gammaproteobacteria bacterium R